MRFVVNAITGGLIDSGKAAEVLLDYVNGKPVYGFIPNRRELTIEINFWNLSTCRFETCMALRNAFEGRVRRSTLSSIYFLPDNVPEEQMLIHTTRMGTHLYPYDFAKKYEAVEHFDIFTNRQRILNMRKFNISRYIKYTFGLEFETSLGSIPEKECFRDGLIPLRDGSISGIEYSTVILKGNPGMSLLAQQIETLKEHTAFNRDCALHVHVGGFPITKEVIFRIYQVCYKLEDKIQSLIPEYSFRTAAYKSNQKDYCKKLVGFNTFEEMYEYLVGMPFNGRFDNPHPRDVDRGHKWNIDTR